MVREFLIHLAHKIKFRLAPKKPFRGRGVLLKMAENIIGEPNREITIKTLYGYKMKIDPVNDAGVERAIYYTGTYEAGTIDVLDKILIKGGIVMDIGANIGLMSLFASQKIGYTGKVYAFEPQPNTHQILAHNCKLNNANNIILSNKALGSSESEGIIYLNMDINRGASSLVKKGEVEGSKIHITTLDKFISENKIDTVDLIKIDVEGYELEMLKGAKNLLSRKDAPIICLEYSSNVEHLTEVGDVYDFLRQVNEYRIFKFLSWKGNISKLIEVHTKDEMPEHDNVFCFLSHHLTIIDKSVFN